MVAFNLYPTLSRPEPLVKDSGDLRNPWTSLNFASSPQQLVTSSTSHGPSRWEKLTRSQFTWWRNWAIRSCFKSWNRRVTGIQTTQGPSLRRNWGTLTMKYPPHLVKSHWHVQLVSIIVIGDFCVKKISKLVTWFITHYFFFNGYWGVLSCVEEQLTYPPRLSWLV